MSLFKSMSRTKFDANKTKVNLKMLTNRFQLLTTKKANLAKQQKRQVALLLRDEKEQNARILVEHIIREARALAAAQRRSVRPLSVPLPAPARTCVWRRRLSTPPRSSQDYTLESYEVLRQYTEMLLARLAVIQKEDELKPEVRRARPPPARACAPRAPHTRS